ncbi:MAG: hypothetical protein E6G92_12575 [Alphaproteobacteria bacterium]|nr:MAG: hypothetical protein E6G92_12575 [Alphaproteobacteria bacterium]
MDDATELVLRLSTAAGMIMEDACPMAISVPTPGGMNPNLADLEQATRDANLLIQAAQVLARRNIR